MNHHLQNLRYLIKHKYYVFAAGLKVGAPIWNLVIHDWQKFLPCEWFAYANNFYNKNLVEYAKLSGDIKNTIKLKDTKEYWREQFQYSWNHHQKSAKHHYQFWILTEDSGTVISLEIPEKYVREMLADWAGAGKAITGKWEVREWYYKNRHKMQLNDRTRQKLEIMIDVYFPNL